MGEIEPRPAARASDHDREQVAEHLRAAAARGQLEMDELDERLTAAFGSRTREELVPLTADLPEGPAHETGVSFAKAPLVRPGEGGAAWVVSVLSGNDRRGRWRVGSRLRVVNLMGGTELDMTDAELSGPVTEITVVSIMGGGEIRVPEGAHVEVSKFGLMGGNDVHLGDVTPPPGAPVIRLRLFALMGGNDVKRGPRKTKQQKRLEKQERQELKRRSQAEAHRAQAAKHLAQADRHERG